MISLGEFLISFSLTNIYFYSYSFEFTSVDMNICLNSNDILIEIWSYNKLPKMVLLVNYILTFITSFNGYVKQSAEIFKFLFIIYLFSIGLVNTNIITLCDIHQLDRIDECQNYCNPYGKYKIPLFEVLTMINIYLFYNYQAIGYRFLFIISLTKSISSVIMNFNHIKEETVSIFIINNDLYKLYGNIIFNLLIIAFTESLYLYARVKSYLTMRTDWKYYDKVYNNLKMKESQQLSEFNSILSNIKQDTENLKQQNNNLDDLYDIGFLLNVKFQKALYSITKRSNGILVPSTVKNPKRSIEKICRHYNRDTRQLCDIIRASILFCNNDKCGGECYKCKSLLSNENEDEVDEKDIVIKIKKSISVCDSFLDISQTRHIPDNEDVESSRNLDEILEISNKNTENTSESKRHMQQFKSKHRSSIFEDVNLSHSFTNHVQQITSNINRISSNSDDSICNYNFCANLLSFIKELNNNEYFQVVKVKNRFDDKYNSRLSLGYRDVLINVKIRYCLNGEKIRLINYSEWADDDNFVIAEIQLHSIDMYNYKVLHGHENYKKYRDIMTI